MMLLLDAGNSALKWAPLSDDGKLGTANVQLHRGVADVATRLASEWHDVPRGVAVIACNVAGSNVAAAVEEAARTLGLQAVRWLNTQSVFSGPVSLVNGYRIPEQLGVDRWHCMLGACASAGRDTTDSLVVVNAGTASTVDCIEANGKRSKSEGFTGTFIGGVIAPGVRLMLESLSLHTAGLPAAKGPASDFPDNTDAAIVSGVLDAQAGLVHQIWHRFATRLKAHPRLVLTGGDAEALSARLSIAANIEHNLVLRGLALRAPLEVSQNQ